MWGFAVKRCLYWKHETIFLYVTVNGWAELWRGIPTSLLASGQQWDFPNGWPPLQHVYILALQKSGSEEAQKIAETMAQKWIESNWNGWNRTRNMFEKVRPRNVTFLNELIISTNIFKFLFTVDNVCDNLSFFPLAFCATSCMVEK